MTAKIKILTAQVNPLVGGIERNSKKVIEIINNHQNTNDIIVFPELTLTGYIPQDLLFRNELHQRVQDALNKIQSIVNEKCFVIIGHPTKISDDELYNSLHIFNNYKDTRPITNNVYPITVFLMKNVILRRSSYTFTLTVKGTTFGVVICEDLWIEKPVSLLLQNNIKNIISINSSPFDYDKFARRLAMLKQHAEKGCSVLYINQCGGQDDVLFDGQSMAVNCNQDITFKAHAFKEKLYEVIFTNNQFNGEITQDISTEKFMYEALKTGLHDYIVKNNFSGVLIGVSGGIDSALTLAIASDALGSENVHGVILPSRFNAPESYEDAIAQLQALNINFSEFSIEPIYKQVLKTLHSVLANNENLTTQNIQARIRMLLLMALSNQTGKLLLNTSNKSEIAVGYSTIYGDLAGSYAVLKDLYKTEVYTLANYRNHIAPKPVIPSRVITKEPSAELQHGQKDTDSLPPYDITDKILKLYIEKNADAEDIINAGFTKHDVDLILTRVKTNEYKRFQAPPGTKISPRAFGKDWRYPITSGFNLKK